MSGYLVKPSAARPVDPLRDAGDESKLLPEFAPYLQDSTLGRCLRHPLVFQIGMILPHAANASLEAKRRRLTALLDLREYASAIWLYERPYRIPALAAWADTAARNRWSELSGMGAETFRRLLAEVWRDTEFPHQFGRLPLLLFRRSFALGARLEDARLPDGDPLTIYRGGRRRGISWTLNLDKAAWFARRFREQRPAAVWSGLVARRHVLAYFEGRGEQEVVASWGKVTARKLPREEWDR